MKKAMTIIMCILLISGCGSGELNNSGSAIPVDEQNKGKIPNDVPQQLKEVDQGKLDTAIPYWSQSYLDLLDSIFFEKRNREAFQRTSHRLYRTGDQFEIDADSLPRDGRYEVKFLKFNEAENQFETILEETVDRNDPDFLIDIPEQENITYYLEQIALNSKNEVLKQEYHRIFVPYNEVNARIDIDKTLYSSGDTMNVTLKNLGTVEIGTGYGVEFEKWDGERWNRYEFEQIVTLQLIILKTGESFSKDVELKGFEKGIYRVIESLPDNHKISAAFTVE
ncbi:immunoglobulin-like domain-containing protein [Bacillus litorisediminis]|uniref:immunoglobulin-like domain-containing protein n=2 Tax=Bacillus litorisediminis TaxID=2922713 RepID=UPI001FAE45C8|nr:immunoglobulin-like domain-containing protein [Bacillus litorisediminis]